MNPANLTDGDLADLEVELTQQLTNVKRVIAHREASRLLQATQAYRETCKANGVLHGFELLVAERKANGASLTAAQRTRVLEQRKVREAKIEDLW